MYEGILTLWLLMAQIDKNRSVIAEVFLSKEDCASYSVFAQSQAPQFKPEDLTCVEYKAALAKPE